VREYFDPRVCLILCRAALTLIVWSEEQVFESARKLAQFFSFESGLSF
jgi:hypothetical protein